MNEDRSATSILKLIPDIRLTPTEELRSMQDKKEVLHRIESEKCRIRPHTKLVALKALVEDIFTPRSTNFHWDLYFCIETVIDKHSLLCSSPVAHQRALEALSSELSYEIGSFVTVNAGDYEHDLYFWVGEVTDRKTASNRTLELTVQWYISYGSSGIYTSKYKPWLVTDSRSWKKELPWKDVVTLKQFIAILGP